MKLTKNLKRIIATSFLQERIPIKSLAELYGFSIGQIENVIRGRSSTNATAPNSRKEN